MGHAEDAELALFLIETSAAVSEIDVHGLSPDAALQEIERWLQSAFARGETGLRVIHGRGAGILRERIHRHLARHPLVGRYRDAERPGTAGGVTLILFKRSD